MYLAQKNNNDILVLLVSHSKNLKEKECERDGSVSVWFPGRRWQVQRWALWSGDVYTCPWVATCHRCASLGPMRARSPLTRVNAGPSTTRTIEKVPFVNIITGELSLLYNTVLKHRRHSKTMNVVAVRNIITYVSSRHVHVPVCTTPLKTGELWTTSKRPKSSVLWLPYVVSQTFFLRAFQVHCKWC